MWVQYTTTKTRLEAYLGSDSPLAYTSRPCGNTGSSGSEFVIWASGLAVLAALLGIVVAVSVYSPARQAISVCGSAVELALHRLETLAFDSWTDIRGARLHMGLQRDALHGSISAGCRGKMGKHRRYVSQRRCGGSIRSRISAKFRRKRWRAGRDFRVKELATCVVRRRAGVPCHRRAKSEPHRSVHGEVAAEYDRNKIIDVIGKAAHPTQSPKKGW